MSAPRIVIQRVRVRWRKASRGGEGARLRNSLPRQLVLPLEAFAAPVTLHRIDFNDATGFRRKERVETYRSLAERSQNELALRMIDDKLEAKHLRNPLNSANLHRALPFVGGIEIAKDEWAELRANGRYVDCDTGHRSFDATTYNVGLFSEIDVDRFTTTKPVKRYADLARL